MLRLPIAFCLLLSLAQVACFEPREGCLEVEATNFDASADKNCCCEYPQLVLDVVQWYDTMQSFTENAAYRAPLNDHLFRLKSVTFYLSDFQLTQNGVTYTVSDTIQLRAFPPSGSDTIREALTNDFLLVRRQSFSNDIGDFRINGTFKNVSIRLGLNEPAGRVIPRLAPTGHPLRVQVDSLWHERAKGYIFAQIVLARDTANATVPDTISFSRADLGDFFIKTTAPVQHTTGYDFHLRLLVEYKKLMKDVDLTTGDILAWKSQLKTNLPDIFSVSQ